MEVPITLFFKHKKLYYSDEEMLDIELDDIENEDPFELPSIIKKDLDSFSIPLIINERAIEWLDDLIYEAIEEYCPSPKGHYHYIDLDIYKDTEKRLREEYEEAIIGAKIDEAIIYEDKAVKLMTDRLYEREEGESYYVDSGRAIINGLDLFSNKGDWHIRFVPITSSKKEQRPVLWFGLDNQPIEDGWLLDYEDDDWGLFWFCTDERANWQSVVTDWDEMLLVWMIYECGEDAVDKEKIINRCPIHFTEKDTQKSIEQKIKQYVRKKHITS